MSNANEILQAEHALNDKLLRLRTKARRIGESVIGGIPPRELPATPLQPQQVQPTPAFLDAVFSTASANHNLADDLDYILDYISGTFGIVPDDKPASVLR